MRDEELDAAIAEYFKVYAGRVRLPDEFTGRFVGSVRRKRMLRRVWTLGLICSAAAVCVTVLGLSKPAAPQGKARLWLAARGADTNNTTKVSCWVLLGSLRECFSRSRSARRKEEEESPRLKNTLSGRSQQQ